MRENEFSLMLNAARMKAGSLCHDRVLYPVIHPLAAFYFRVCVFIGEMSAKL